MARNRRAGARRAVLRPSPLCGGWLRAGPPRWPACRCSAPFGASAAAPRWGAWAAPFGGSLSPARAPRRLWGRALVWRVRRLGLPPRCAPRCVAGAGAAGPPLGGPRWRFLRACGAAALRRAGLRFACPAGYSAAAAAVGAAIAAQAYKAGGFATPAAQVRHTCEPLTLSHILTPHTAYPRVRTEA